MKKCDKIRELATTFRQALEKNKHILTLPTLENFPNGSCGDASILLAKFLSDSGCGTFEYVMGWRDTHSHAWLQQAELIIDITADQFNDINESVIVTTDSSWHKHFNGKIMHIASINSYDENIKKILLDNYIKILFKYH